MTCIKCGLEHDSSSNQKWCRDCRREYDKARYNTTKEQDRLKSKRAELRARNRKFVRDYLESHPCVDCGNNDIRVLEFDHIRGEKLKEVTVMASQQYSIQKIQEEIEKCEVRCANCHRIRTVGE